jgi:F0F1-type ATP synthase assembly protein I
MWLCGPRWYDRRKRIIAEAKEAEEKAEKEKAEKEKAKENEVRTI